MSRTMIVRRGGDRPVGRPAAYARRVSGTPRPRRFELRGRILGCGFAAGDRLVVGMWDRSPIGPFADVMWAEADGTRVLYADERAASFITAVYGFDRVVHGSVAAAWRPPVLEVAAGEWTLSFTTGRGVPMPWRPAWVSRHVEAPIARRLLGVETYGVSPTGVREWYRARRWHRVLGATAEGPRALGAIGALTPRCGFGFSEPPSVPSLTEVRPLLHDPSGALDAVIAALR
jgi:hypothetical protein